MKLRVTVSNSKGYLLNDFYVIAPPSEDAATDQDRNDLANKIMDAIAWKWDVDETNIDELPDE